MKTLADKEREEGKNKPKQVTWFTPIKPKSSYPVMRPGKTKKDRRNK